MLPHIRHIQRLEIEGESGGQSTHCDEGGVEKGMGTDDREFAEDGCEERRVWEYRHTGHLVICKSQIGVERDVELNSPAIAPFTETSTVKGM